jgi:hypothetical protein
MLMHPMEEVMKRRSMVWSLFVCAASLASYLTYSLALSRDRITNAAPARITQGSLQAIDAQGQPRALCPLKNTAVSGSISGGLSRVTVTQHFVNPYPDKSRRFTRFPAPPGRGLMT